MNGFEFAIAHMPAVRRAIGLLPMSVFMGINDAPAQKDLEEATDLVLNLDRVAIGVRIRSTRYYHIDASDLSVRYECRGHRTEIHKLREGFGDYYFIGFSANNKNELADWWILDLHEMRRDALFAEETIRRNRWQISPNGDRTSGLYIPLRLLREYTIARCDAFCGPVRGRVAA